MGAEVGSNSTGSKRWRAFLTYAHKDNAEYIKNFYEVFTRELELSKIGGQGEFYLDASQQDKAGDVRRYLDEHASHADFLIIFVGKHYPSRPFCLHEWLAFRNQFDDRNKVRDRLFIIEIDKGALATLTQTKVDGQEDISKERAEDLEACFHEEFWQDDKRIISRREDGKLNELFEQKVEHVAEVFANRYRKLAPPPEPPTPHPEWGGVKDVLIGPWTEDLKENVDALRDAVRAAGKTCDCLPNWADIGNADEVLLEKMRVAVSAAGQFVQPYSIGHAEIQPPRRAHFDFFKDSRASLPTLYWRPSKDVGGTNPDSNAVREIDSRWTDAKAWVGDRLKQVEVSAIVGPAGEVLARLQRRPAPGGPKIFLGGIVQSELEFDLMVRLNKFADGVREFLTDFWTQQCSEAGGQERKSIDIEINRMQDFLKLSPDRVREYSGIILLNRFTEKDSLVAQMEEVERTIEKHGDRGRFEFRVFLCMPPPDIIQKGSWRPIFFELNGTGEDGFQPKKYEAEKLKSFLIGVAGRAG